MLGCVFEINHTKVIKLDFYQLTQAGKSKVRSCNEPLTLHPSCSGQSFYKSVADRIDFMLVPQNELSILDTRDSANTVLKINFAENVVKIKCNACDKDFPINSIMKHASQSKACKAALKQNKRQYADAFYKDETNRNQIVKRQSLYNK